MVSAGVMAPDVTAVVRRAGRIHVWYRLPDTMQTSCLVGLDVLAFSFFISGHFFWALP